MRVPGGLCTARKAHGRRGGGTVTRRPRGSRRLGAQHRNRENDGDGVGRVWAGEEKICLRFSSIEEVLLCTTYPVHTGIYRMLVRYVNVAHKYMVQSLYCVSV